MRNRAVLACAFLGLASLLGGCSDGQFVFFPATEPETAVHPIQQTSGDSAGMTAFAPRSEELPESTAAEAAATNTVDASVMR